MQLTPILRRYPPRGKHPVFRGKIHPNTVLNHSISPRKIRGFSPGAVGGGRPGGNFREFWLNFPPGAKNTPFWPLFDRLSPGVFALLNPVFFTRFSGNFGPYFPHFTPRTPPNFEIFLIDKKSTVCYRKLHFLWKVGLGGSIGEDGISFFQFFEKKLTILIHRAQKSMVFSRKMGSKKWVKFNKK